MSAARDDLRAHLITGTDEGMRRADELIDAFRTEVLREAARVLEDTGRDDDAVNLLDLLADLAAPCPDIHHGLTRPHTTTECPKDGDPS